MARTPSSASIKRTPLNVAKALFEYHGWDWDAAHCASCAWFGVDAGSLTTGQVLAALARIEKVPALNLDQIEGIEAAYRIAKIGANDNGG